MRTQSFSESVGLYVYHSYLGSEGSPTGAIDVILIGKTPYCSRYCLMPFKMADISVILKARYDPTDGLLGKGFISYSEISPIVKTAIKSITNANGLLLTLI